MRTIRSLAVAMARFLYDFIFGDDPSVALVILLGLLATGWLISNAISAWWLVPLLAIAMTGVSLRRARRARVSRAR